MLFGPSDDNGHTRESFRDRHTDVLLESALNGMDRMGCSLCAGPEFSFSPTEVYPVLASPPENVSLRDLEPVLGWFVRETDPRNDANVLESALTAYKNAAHWTSVQRGGYVLSLLCLFSKQSEAWQDAGLWAFLEEMAGNLLDVRAIPYFPKDTRETARTDFLARMWKLSSGVLYDRLKRMQEPPYVC